MNAGLGKVQTEVKPEVLRIRTNPIATRAAAKALKEGKSEKEIIQAAVDAVREEANRTVRAPENPPEVRPDNGGPVSQGGQPDSGTPEPAEISQDEKFRRWLKAIILQDRMVNGVPDVDSFETAQLADIASLSRLNYAGLEEWESTRFAK